jgi:hypothetical protein
MKTTITLHQTDLNLLVKNYLADKGLIGANMTWSHTVVEGIHVMADVTDAPPPYRDPSKLDYNDPKVNPYAGTSLDR